MSNPTRPPTPYERFVDAMKVVISVPKKDVDQAIRALRRKRERRRARKAP